MAHHLKVVSPIQAVNPPVLFFANPFSALGREILCGGIGFFPFPVKVGEAFYGLKLEFLLIFGHYFICEIETGKKFAHAKTLVNLAMAFDIEVY